MRKLVGPRIQFPVGELLCAHDQGGNIRRSFDLILDEFVRTSPQRVFPGIVPGMNWASVHLGI